MYQQRLHGESLNDIRVRRRRSAVELFASTDLSIAEVARQIGVTRKYVSIWHTAYETGNSDAVLDVKDVGARNRLTDEQCVRIREIILKGAMAAGYPNELWTQKRIAEMIDREIGVSYHPNYIRVLMASMKISSQKPHIQPHARNNNAIQTWHDDTWPHVKKRNRRAKNHSVLR